MGIPILPDRARHSIQHARHQAVQHLRGDAGLDLAARTPSARVPSNVLVPS